MKLLFSVTLKDCTVQTFRAGGKGGQHQNKTETGVRIIHVASGARGEARDSRSQIDNKRAAFHRMGHTAAFQAWCRAEAARMNGTQARIARQVDEWMQPEHLRIECIEVLDGERWVAAS